MLAVDGVTEERIRAALTNSFDLDVAVLNGADVKVVAFEQSHADQWQAFGFLHAHCTVLTLPNDCRSVSFEDATITTTKFDIDGANLPQIQVPDRSRRKR